jgi:hypothetical protein
MILKPSTWLLVALTGGALLAGCGSSSSSSTSSTSTTTGGAATGSQSSPNTNTTGTSSPLSPAQQEQAATTCKHGIQSQSKITGSAKTKLEAICEKAAKSGTAAGLQTVAQEVCLELVKSAHLPAGPARERAQAICKGK